MLGKIYKSALKLFAAQTLEEIYKATVKEAIDLTQADYGSIFLGEKGVLHRVYTTAPLSTRTEPRSDGYAYKSFRTGQSFILSAKLLREIHPALLKNGIKSLVLIPIAYHKKTLGLLTLQSKKDKHFNNEKLNLLKLFGSLISLSIQNAKLYNETKTALKTRDLFISMAAHELRTPTTTIQGYVQMMKKKCLKGEALPQKWIDILETETIRLSKLLGELLRVEQIKTGQLKYHWQENSIREILARAMSNFKISHPKNRVVLQDQLNKKNDMLYSDFDKLLQAITNLLHNSVKFSPPQSEITITLSHDKSFYKISVIDRGRGIPKRDLPHVFEGFYKGRDHTREGMGLGLFLAENIIQRHKGFISIDSTVGKGTTCEIRLPKN
ncbi:MAG: hypothetical protein A3G66_03910 [Candidatus Levybacteria bacterium RIFCSPLOWO2_12_FULL_39_17]|nr:MAG: hypothetical protein A3G66_03910 [Candidatus Levybacteria bacterium RIFCSPLOWO2_12_FULL_39_17]